MKNRLHKNLICAALAGFMLFASACGNVSDMTDTTSGTSGIPSTAVSKTETDPSEKTENETLKQEKDEQNKGSNYTLEQALSDNAQLTTIAFSGLAFITGSNGADTFMPPGKVADFFGFQYMRDVDIAGYGHNTQFLTRAASNVLYILNDAQKQELAELAKSQAPLYTAFAYNRFPIMNAFRQSLEGREGLNQTAVAEYTSNLYRYDAQLSYERAVL